MQTYWSVYSMLSMIVLSGIIGYTVLIVVIHTNPNKASEASLVRLALKSLGIDRAAWQTVAVSASQDVDLTTQALWKTWSRLENWPAWSTRHRSAKWLQAGEIEQGARFLQVQKLGFPLGVQTSIETISEFSSERRVRWCHTQGGVKSCHFWTFTLLPNRKVRVTNTEVLHGTLIGLLKPIVYWQWQRQFEKSLDGFIRQTRLDLQNQPANETTEMPAAR